MSAHKSETNQALWLAAGSTSEGTQGFEIRPLAEVERIYIEMVIMLCEGNIPRAAALLQISPSTIYRKKAAWQQPA